MFEMKCPTCDGNVAVSDETRADEKFNYCSFKCGSCEHKSEFALRSIQNES